MTEALNLALWLEALGKLVAGRMPAADVKERLGAMAGALREEFPPATFTAESLRHVAGSCKAFPTYGMVRGLLVDLHRSTRPALPAAAVKSGGRPGAGLWLPYAAKRLSEGADRAHILSLVRAYAEPDELRAIMAQHFRDELRAEEKRAVDVQRDKAARAAAVASLTAAALAPPQLAASHPAPAEPAAAPAARTLSPGVLLELLDGEILSGRATEATRSRAEALRRQVEAQREAAKLALVSAAAGGASP